MATYGGQFTLTVDRVSHTVDIHLSDTKIAVRDSLQRRTQGGGGFHGLRIR